MHQKLTIFHCYALAGFLLVARFPHLAVIHTEQHPPAIIAHQHRVYCSSKRHGPIAEAVAHSLRTNI